MSPTNAREHLQDSAKCDLSAAEYLQVQHLYVSQDIRPVYKDITQAYVCSKYDLAYSCAKRLA